MMAVLKKQDIYSSLILFLIIFQSCGVRLFDGIGFLISIVVICLLIRKVRLTATSWVKLMGLIAITLILFCLKGVSVGLTLNIVLLLISSFFYVLYVNKKGTFLGDFGFVLKIICIHAAINAILDLVLPNALLTHTNYVITDTTFLYLFYFTHSELPFLGMTRLTGFMWEPGCLQMFLNIYIFICISRGKQLKDYAYVFFLVFLTGSTSGYIIMLLNICFFLYRSKKIKMLLFGAGVAVAIVPFFYEAISEKMTVGNSASATIRYRDIYIGIKSVAEHPILGIEFTDLSQSKDIQRYEMDAINYVLGRDSWFDSFDTLAGGYTNGFFLLFMIWGIVGWLFYYSFFRCKLWRQCAPVFPIFIPIIIALSMISEPISNTSFIYMFCIYNFIAGKSSIRKHEFFLKDNYI